MNEMVEQYKEEKRNGRWVRLPIDYEKEYTTATDKLHYHTSQQHYHLTMRNYYQQQIEELLPFTNIEEKRLAKQEADKLAKENSPEYKEMKKRLRRKKADLLVERMLRESGEV